VRRRAPGGRASLARPRAARGARSALTHEAGPRPAGLAHRGDGLRAGPGPRAVGGEKAQAGRHAVQDRAPHRVRRRHVHQPAGGVQVRGRGRAHRLRHPRRCQKGAPCRRRPPDRARRACARYSPVCPAPSGAWSWWPAGEQRCNRSQRRRQADLERARQRRDARLARQRVRAAHALGKRTHWAGRAVAPHCARKSTHRRGARRRCGRASAAAATGPRASRSRTSRCCRTSCSCAPGSRWSCRACTTRSRTCWRPRRRRGPRPSAPPAPRRAPGAHPNPTQTLCSQCGLVWTVRGRCSRLRPGGARLFRRCRSA